MNCALVLSLSSGVATICDTSSSVFKAASPQFCLLSAPLHFTPFRDCAMPDTNTPLFCNLFTAFCGASSPCGAMALAFPGSHGTKVATFHIAAFDFRAVSSAHSFCLRLVLAPNKEALLLRLDLGTVFHAYPLADRSFLAAFHLAPLDGGTMADTATRCTSKTGATVVLAFSTLGSMTSTAPLIDRPICTVVIMTSLAFAFPICHGSSFAHVVVVMMIVSFVVVVMVI